MNLPWFLRLPFDKWQLCRFCLIGINATRLQSSNSQQKVILEIVMRPKLRTRVIECPSQKRQVEVTYTVTGSWFKREYDVVSCPAINDWGGGCHRECKLQLEHPPGFGDGYLRH